MAEEVLVHEDRVPGSENGVRRRIRLVVLRQSHLGRRGIRVLGPDPKVKRKPLAARTRDLQPHLVNT